MSQQSSWTKYRACDATSAHWYALEQFERYAGAMIAAIHAITKVTVREFAAQFRGMSATEQKQILHEVGASHLSLHRFFGSETAGQSSADGEAAVAVAAAHPPGAPGIARRDRRGAFPRLCISVGGEPKSFKYFISPEHDADGRPYVIEIATCAYKKWVAGKEEKRRRYLVTGVNFSATLENPFNTLRAWKGWTRF